MGASVYTIYANGAGPMADAANVPAGEHYRVLSVSLRFVAAAPATAEDFTVTKDSGHGPDWDLLWYSVDPGAGGLTDILWQPDEELFLVGGDALLCEYANTDRRAYTLEIKLKRVP